MENLFTIKGLKLDNKNIEFFSSDMLNNCEFKTESGTFIAKDTETLFALLSAVLDCKDSENGLGIAFMNNGEAYIAFKAIKEFGIMNSVKCIRQLNNMVEELKIDHMIIVQQSSENEEEFYFISDGCELSLN